MSDNASALALWLGEAALGTFFGLCCLYFYGIGAIGKATLQGKAMPGWVSIVYGEPREGQIYNSPVGWAFFMVVSALGVLASLWAFHENRIFLQPNPVSLKDYFSGRASLAQVMARETAFPLFLLLTYIISALLLNRYLRKLKGPPENPA